MYSNSELDFWRQEKLLLMHAPAALVEIQAFPQPMHLTYTRKVASTKERRTVS